MSMPPSDEVLSIEVPCDEHAPRTVRRRLAAVHDGSWSLDDGLLVASELVTNAVRHSGCVDEHRLRVEVGGGEGGLVISVQDPGISGSVAEAVQPRRLHPTGRGLHIVQQLSVRWGSERRRGYRVW